jgi:hypothetical protein
MQETFMMRARRDQVWPDRIVVGPPVNLHLIRPRRASVIGSWQHATQRQDEREARLRRRDHRIALALMIGSSLVSILTLLAIWVLLRRVI